MNTYISFIYYIYIYIYIILYKEKLSLGLTNYYAMKTYGGVDI
jgi:hypothetical protein